ncbi:MAG: RCC1 domain-containing protein, partial [Ilumatobacteraceae bacterium]
MSIKPRFSRILAGLALMAGVVTFGQLPGAPAPSASAAVELAAPWQYGTVIAGGEHLCFVGNTSLHCAGDNANGQIGDGTTTDTTHGKQVKDATNNMLLANAFKATVGLNHSCMLTSGTRIMYCWGDNQYGQLGDGTTTDRSVPTIVADNTASGFVNSGLDVIISGHNHTCVTKLGQMYCWGRNDQGQLGNTSTTDSSLAVKPAAPFATADAMNALSAGEGHTCATVSTGNRPVYCWGDNQYGQLGNGSNTDSTSPVMVSGTVARNAQQEGSLAASAHSTCVASGEIGSEVVCWGRNNNGQLGNGTITSSNVPVQAVAAGPGGGATYRVIAAGGDTVCMRAFIGTTSVV